MDAPPERRPPEAWSSPVPVCASRGKEALPRSAGIDAAKDAAGAGVDHICVERVEHEELHGVTQVDDAPGGAAIVREVGAGHIAGDQRRAAIVRTDGGMVERSAATGSDDAPAIGAGLRLGRGPGKDGGDGEPQASHYPLWSHAISRRALQKK